MLWLLLALLPTLLLTLLLKLAGNAAPTPAPEEWLDARESGVACCAMPTGSGGLDASDGGNTAALPIGWAESPGAIPGGGGGCTGTVGPADTARATADSGWGWLVSDEACGMAWPAERWRARSPGGVSSRRSSETIGGDAGVAACGAVPRAAMAADGCCACWLWWWWWWPCIMCDGGSMDDDGIDIGAAPYIGAAPREASNPGGAAAPATP